MNLAQARDIVRQFARNAADESIATHADVDRAIQAALDDFIWHTRCTRRDDEVEVGEDAQVVTVAITDFRAERILRTYMTAYGDLQILEHSELLRKRVADGAVGRPLYVAFTTATTMHVYPKADDDYLVRVVWVPPIAVFAPGVEAASGVTLDLPDDYLRTILAYGAPALLQHNEPEHDFAAASWAKYEAFRNRMTAAGSLGAKSTARAGAEF